MASEPDARALGSRARSENASKSAARESAHLSPYLPNQRVIRDLLVRGRSISERGEMGKMGEGVGGGGEPLGMLCPDLVHITAVIKGKMKGSHILDTTAAGTRCEWA